MTTLPSFVELMSSLGLDKHPPPVEPSSPSFSSPPSSPPSSPCLFTTSFPTHSRSTSRDHLPRHRIARYSPYLLSTRRGSLPSASPRTAEFQSMRASSTSPRLLSSSARRRNGTNLSTNVYGSVSDLTANTPISIYVRRKTPSISPTSPTFPEDSPVSPMPFSLPTLPHLFPHTLDSYSIPSTPKSETQQPTSDHNAHHAKFLPEMSETEPYNHRFYRYTSVRISTPSDVNHRRSELSQMA